MGVGAAFVTLSLSPPSSGQVELTGRLWHARAPGAQEMLPFGSISGFASLDGPGAQTVQHRVWETEPAGWYRFAGPSGRYTFFFTLPGHFMRPTLLTNVFTRDGDRVDRNVIPRFDQAVFDEREWDPDPALEYIQLFRAAGRSVTHVGFKLASDGVDGVGPASQDVTISIHKVDSGPPSGWKQIGPSMIVPAVDCGGPKSYAYSAGWNSGEVKTMPREQYAVRLRPAKAGGNIQAFWRAAETPDAQSYRKDGAGWSRQKRSLWMSVASDGDGLLIPYNKRVWSSYKGETHFARKWSQTYVAQGRSLAGVSLFAAFSGVQPGLMRQRAVVRVRKGGPSGPVVGVEKIAIGSGNYTGDASWGLLGCAYSPGEVPLVPGSTYAIEFESIENRFTLHGFVNIKGMPSDDNPGFHPYPKVSPDDYAQGSAYLNGTQKMPYDLDMQITEYLNALPGWERALESTNLVRNWQMAAGADGWAPFRIDPATVTGMVADENDQANSVARVLGGGATGKTADGGWVQRVGGVSHADTYRLSLKLRSTWAVDPSHQLLVGYDPTGQTQDPLASSVVWSEPYPKVAGVWVTAEVGPLRPAEDSVSIWLRARTTLAQDFPFKADFDALSLRKVKEEIAGGRSQPGG